MNKADILLVEDDRNMREALCEMLESAGYAVTTCADGAAALDKANSSTPQLVITDLVMPDKTGVEFIRSLRRGGGALAKVPILVLTGYDGMVVQGAKLAGASKILRKPNDLERLTETVDELLQGSAS
ncbi:MAG TPA: response regulator [Blastocatellia bacterium]|nr:response regulator [Blastocatellia bacterium]